MPEDLNALVLLNPTRLYPLLFDSAAQSLLQFGRNRLEGDLGISAVLHTWGQQLNFHPHLHCIVTGGALSPDGQRWRSPKQRKFLFPVKALSALFRGKFLGGLKGLVEADPQMRQRWFSKLYAQKWVVYAKRPSHGRCRPAWLQAGIRYGSVLSGSSHGPAQIKSGGRLDHFGAELAGQTTVTEALPRLFDERSLLWSFRLGIPLLHLHLLPPRTTR